MLKRYTWGIARVPDAALLRGLGLAVAELLGTSAALHFLSRKPNRIGGWRILTHFKVASRGEL
jgi:hypothetical protein